LEKTILRWLENRPEGWGWLFDGVKYSKTETIEKFKKDKRFRKLLTSQVYKLAVELFEKQS